MPCEEVDFGTPIRLTNEDGQNRNKEIDRMKEEIWSFEETMKYYWPKIQGLKGQGAITILVKVTQKQQEIQPQRLTERSKRRKQTTKHRISNTLQTPTTLLKSLQFLATSYQ